MTSRSDYITQIVRSASTLIYSRASRARIRFLDTDSQVTETADQSLLRRRIRAAAVVLLVAKFALMLRSLVLHGEAAPMDGIILLGLSAITIWLYSPRNVSMLWLRTVETSMFLGISLQLGVLLHQELQELTAANPQTGTDRANDAVRFVAAVKDQIIATFGLMMIYGMFIPNTARRAALVVFVMAITPAVVIARNESSVETIRRFRSQHVAARGIFSGNLLSLAIGAGCAIYGTAMMNRWRTRALEAEQLGQYRLRYKIGSGGMGDVYLAEHRQLKRECAVKLIRAELSGDPVVLNRFEREVQATAALTHWNTVQVFDYGQTTEGTFFYVMEHLHGRNLRQMVRAAGRMPDARVVFSLRQECEALREAVARGLVHRDIKPSNIFLARVGERCDVVKLLDFGLVRPLGEMADAGLSGANELKGSPRFMCPEQAQGQSPDGRGDLYSLGATAYFMLAGRPPFDLDNILKLVIAHATEQPPAFHEIGVHVSPELSAVIFRCLQKKPEDRYQNPDELLEALSALPVETDWNWTVAEKWWNERLPDTVSGQTTEVQRTIIASREDLEPSLDDTVIEPHVAAQPK